MRRTLNLSFLVLGLTASAQRYIGLQVANGGAADLPYTNFPMAANAAGEVYCAVPFNQPITIGGTTLNPVQNGFNDIALVKLTPTGEVIWAKAFGSNNSEDPLRLAVDGLGQVYVSWSCANGVVYYFDETGTTTSFPNLGAPFYGFTCFSADGLTLWHKPGVFSTPQLAASTEEPGVFAVDQGAIRRLNEQGDVLWQVAPEPANALVPLSAALAGDKLAIAGYGANNLNVVTVDTVTATVQYLQAGVVFLMDTSGSALWGRPVGNNNGYGESIRHLAIDPAGNAVYCGLDVFHGVLDFAGGTLANPNGPGNGMTPVLKFDLDGNESWGRFAAGVGTSPLELNALAPAPGGGVYLGGKMSSGALVFGSISIPATSGQVKAFQAKLDADGEAHWWKFEPTHGGPGVNSITRSMLTLTDGSLLTANYFWSGFFPPVKTGCLQAPNPNNRGMYFSRIDPSDSEPNLGSMFTYSMSGNLFFGRAPALEEPIPTTYAWSFGDGGTTSGEAVAHVFQSVGSFQVCMTASNTCGTAQHCAWVDHAGLRAIEPRAGGQGGVVSALVLGGGFVPGTTWKLTRSGEADIVPSQLTVGNSAALFGRLDLQGAALGPWNVEATVPGLGTFTLPDAFTVQPLRKPRMTLHASGQRSWRAGSWSQHTLRVSNIGNEDAVLVPLHIELPEPVEVFWFTEAIDRHSVPGLDEANAAMDAAGGYEDDLVFRSPGYGIKRMELILPLVGANSYLDFRIWTRFPQPIQFRVHGRAYPPLIGSRALVDATVMPEEGTYYLNYLENAGEWTMAQAYDHAEIWPYIRDAARAYAGAVGGAIGGTGGWPYGNGNPGPGQTGGIGIVNNGPIANQGGNRGYATPPLVVTPPINGESQSGGGNGAPPGPPGGPPPPPPQVPPPPPNCWPNGCCSPPCYVPDEPWPYEEDEEIPVEPPPPQPQPPQEPPPIVDPPPRTPGNDGDNSGQNSNPQTPPAVPSDPDGDLGCWDCDDGFAGPEGPGYGGGGLEDCPLCDPLGGGGSNSWMDELWDFLAAFDPNAVHGPVRHGDIYLNDRRDHGYTITFENLASATAPANRVLVIDTLDVARFDPYSFRFSTITLGDSAVLYCDPQVWDGNYLIDMVPQSGLYVGVHTLFDPVTGVIRVEFTGYDPATLALPANALAGFLPPNANAREGTGSVSFIVNYRSTVGHGESVSTRAAIWFDDNPPILTNTWTNILDFVKPTGQVAPLQPVSGSDTLHIVLTNASDDLSGIAYHHVFVSVNGHMFRRFVMTAGDTVIYRGLPGVNYRFFSRAVDKAGNVEDYPAEFWNNPDAETDIVTKAPALAAEARLTVHPNPAREQIVCTLILPEAGEARIELLNAMGAVVARPDGNRPLRLPRGDHRFMLPVQQLAAGAYVLKAALNTGVVTTKVMVE